MQDLWDLRIAKLRSSVDSFVKDGCAHASINHLTPMEINSVRPGFPDSLNALTTLHEVRGILILSPIAYVNDK